MNQDCKKLKKLTMFLKYKTFAPADVTHQNINKLIQELRDNRKKVELQIRNIQTRIKHNEKSRSKEYQLLEGRFQKTCRRHYRVTEELQMERVIHENRQRLIEDRRSNEENLTGCVCIVEQLDFMTRLLVEQERPLWKRMRDQTQKECKRFKEKNVSIDAKIKHIDDMKSTLDECIDDMDDIFHELDHVGVGDRVYHTSCRSCGKQKIIC
jgi:hypothetical protein